MRKFLAAIGITATLLLSAGTAQAAECEPVSADTTEWTTDSVAPDGYTLVDTRTVTDEEAYDEVISEAVPAQHYSYKGGPIEGQPLPPSEDPDSWQANATIEPHLQGGGEPATWVGEVGVGLHYTSHQSEGLADWFYFQPAVDAVIEHHDAVTHEEYKYHRDAVKCDDDDKPKPPPGDDKNPPKDVKKPLPPKLAMTGFTAGPAAAVAGALGLIGALSLFATRKKGIA